MASPATLNDVRRPQRPERGRDLADGLRAGIEAVVAESLKAPAFVWQAAIRGMIERDCADELHRIPAPTRLLWGERDAFISRTEQDTLNAGIPGATLRTYPGTGHAPHWEQPEEVAGDLVEFVTRQVFASASPART